MPDDMKAWDFAHRSGFGVVAGPVSGHVECWDWDDRDTFDKFIEAAEVCGLGNVVKRIREGYEDSTPRGGRRWLVKFPESVTWQDRTLARRPGKGKGAETLVELPTFNVVAPSNGRVHPTGKPYTRLSGNFDTIASYTADEREGLIGLALSFDEMPKRQHTPQRSKAEPETDRPGDLYNAQTTWPELLERHGWTSIFERDGVGHWCRPGKSVGVSATTGYGGTDLLYVFTSSTEFEPEKTYSKFAAYAVLEHGGDFSKAALALAKQGFGQQDEAPPPPPPVAPSRPHTLVEVEAVFAKWVPDPDPVPTRAMLATYSANRELDGDPTWLMLVGGSGVGKTERLALLAVMPDVIFESSITGPAALLSGTARKERSKDATGGLLHKVPADGGLLVLKDFTSIIDMHRESRAEVLAALREVHDGAWSRSVGVDGGRTLTWAGHLGLLAGCTTAIDSAHAVMSTMGARFLLVRLKGDVGIARSAFDHSGESVPPAVESQRQR